MFRSPLITAGPRAPAAPQRVSEPDNSRDRAELDAAHQLKVKAVMIGPDRVALINGRAHRVGDFISDFRLIGIEPDHIVLERAGIAVTLGLQ